MRNPILLIKEIADLYLRKNFELLQEYFDKENQLLGFKFVEFSTDGAVTNLKVPHLLGFIPRDLIRTGKIGTSSVTFNRGLFDAENLDVTTAGAVRVRLLAGTYRNDETNPAIESTQTETWS